MDVNVEKKISEVLEEKVNPALRGHFGEAILTEYKDGVAYVRFLGECARCPSADVTMQEFVKVVIMNDIDEVQDVILDDTVSDDLLDFARQILSKEK